MPRNWTAEQETAITATNKTVLLSAAAGSGKTATLTERLIRMITRKENPLDISRILVVTFTRDAAEELRIRIAAALDEALAKEPENKHLMRASLLLPSAKIRTIDSFCNDLVKGHTETLGIKGRYRIPDAAETKLLSTELLDELVFDAYNGTFAPEGLDIATLSECTVGARNKKDLSAILSDLYEKLGSYPDGLKIIKEGAEEMERVKALPFFDTRWGKEIQKAALSLLSDFEEGLSSALAAAVGDELFDKTLAPLGRALKTRVSEAKAAAQVSYSALRASLNAPLKEGNDPTASDEKLSEEGFHAKRYRKHVLSEIEDFKEKYLIWEEKDIPEAFEKNAALDRSIYFLLSEFERRFAEEKRARGLCTYGDLEHFAYRLLWNGDGTRTPLAEELSSSFDAVCIDEYQDVNDVQHRIFEAISTPTNRFMVGDIKQSIYYFRGARPDIFADLRRSFPPLSEDADEALLYLTKNFRSLPSLIRFNNGVFDFLFGKLGERIGYVPSDRLVAGKDEPKTPQPPPEVLYLHTPAHAEKDEWDMVAAKIKELLKDGKRADGSPILPSDIAVLYRQGAAKRFEIASALSRYGISVSTEDTQNFFLFPEILLALCLLFTVENPRRDVFLAGLLRSPLYGFSMEELLHVKRKAKKDDLCLFDALCRYTEEHPDFKKGTLALRDIRDFRAMAENTPSDRLFDALLCKTALFALADEAGKERLRVLYDYARTFENNHFHGLFRFVSHLGELIEAGHSLGAKRFLGDADGVKIGTMHSSKGLEYPVTFVVNTMPHPTVKDSSLRFHPAFGVAAKIRDASGLGVMKNPVRRAVMHRVEEEEGDEEIRVLYVALTRACERLFVTAASVSQPDTVLERASLVRRFPSASLVRRASPLSNILAAVGKDPSLCSFRMLSQDDLDSLDKADEIREREEQKEAAKETADMRERFAFRYPHETEAALPGKISVSRLYPALLDEEESPLDKGEKPTDASSEEEKKERRATVPFFLSGIEADAAAKAGTATHLFLQFCRFSSLAPNGEDSACTRVKKELARLTREGFIHKNDAARVRTDELARFAESELLSRILSAERVKREFRFNTMLPASLFSKEHPERYAGLEVFTQGVIDLVLENEDGSLSLCDYKTDRLKKDALLDAERAKAFLTERHGTQLFYYAEALSRIFGKRPSRIEIFSLHAGQSFEIDPIP